MQTFKQFLTESKVEKIENESYIQLTLFDRGERVGKAIILKQADTKGFWLSEIYIVPKFRREGYGTNLMYAVVKLQQEYKVPFYLRAWATEQRATSDEKLIQLYGKFGFVQVPNSPNGVMVRR